MFRSWIAGPAWGPNHTTAQHSGTRTECELTDERNERGETRHTEELCGLILGCDRRASAWLDGAWFQGVREWNPQVASPTTGSIIQGRSIRISRTAMGRERVNAARDTSQLYCRRHGPLEQVGNHLRSCIVHGVRRAFLRGIGRTDRRMLQPGVG